MHDDIKLYVPQDCGNAPRKMILRDFNIAFVTKDHTILLQNIADQVRWTIIGDETVLGKEKFIQKLASFQKDPVAELHIYYIITHGYTASVNGKVNGTHQSYHFCHVYRFNGSSKSAKISEITSYILYVK